MKTEKEIVLDTINCRKDFICLKDPKACCSVLDCIDGTIHFVDYTSKVYCGYKMNFGNAKICNCPTRKEIFNKYTL